MRRRRLTFRRSMSSATLMRHVPRGRLRLLPPRDHDMLFVPQRRMLAPCLGGGRRFLMGSLDELAVLGTSGLGVALRGKASRLGLRGPGLDVSRLRLRRGSGSKLLVHLESTDPGPLLRGKYRRHGRTDGGLRWRLMSDVSARGCCEPCLPQPDGLRRSGRWRGCDRPLMDRKGLGLSGRHATRRGRRKGASRPLQGLVRRYSPTLRTR